MLMPTESVAVVYHTHAHEGRAVLAWSPFMGHAGEPVLWICRVDGTYVLCDDVGPDTATAPWEGLYQEVEGTMTLAEVWTLVKAHRAAIRETHRIARALATTT